MTCRFQEMRRYARANTDLSGILIFTNATTEFLVIDSQGRRTGHDPNTGEILEEIPNTSYYLQTPLIDDTFENSLQPPEGSGTFFFEALDPSAGQYYVTVFGKGNYEITFRGYDQDAEVSEQILQELTRRHIL